MQRLEKKLLQLTAIVFLSVSSFYLFFLTHGIAAGDSGDVTTSAVLGGVPHPPGYPLFTFLGWIVSHLPLSTPAWRVGLLSLFPHAAVVAITFYLTYKIRKNLIAAGLAALWIAGNYLFFLYSIVPEFFALYHFFFILLLLLAYLFYKTGNQKLLIVFACVLGFSFAHHYLILFALPGFAWLMFPRLRKERLKKATVIPMIVVFLVGLLPYLYFPWAGRGTAIVNWSRPNTLHRFVRLVLREDYGSFLSAGIYGAKPEQRLVQLDAYLRFILMDVRSIGIVFLAIGAYAVYRRERRLFISLFIIQIILGPFFFFYASFPIINRFMLGTFERFLIIGYMLFAPLIGIGIVTVGSVGVAFIRRSTSRSIGTVAVGIMSIVLLLYPASTLAISTYRLWGIAGDYTLNRLGMDILDTVKPGSIIVLARDTPLFVTQYVRYALPYREDVVVLQASRLLAPDYQELIAERFPDVIVPNVDPADFHVAFALANSPHKTIYTNSRSSVPRGYLWVPRGLLYELMPEERIPTIDQLITENSSLMTSYQDPRQGILSRYPHLMLSDVLDVYAGSYGDIGVVLLKSGKYTDASVFLERAVALASDTIRSEVLKYLGVAQLKQNLCYEALETFEKARQIHISLDPEISLYEKYVYADCLHDSERAKERQAIYEQEKRLFETELEAWR